MDPGSSAGRHYSTMNTAPDNSHIHSTLHYQDSTHILWKSGNKSHPENSCLHFLHKQHLREGHLALVSVALLILMALSVFSALSILVALSILMALSILAALSSAC